MTGRIRNPWVVVAAYNEAPVVGSVVSGIRAAGYAVVVVDDGSSDRSGDVAMLAGAVVIRHPVNLGQGAALRLSDGYPLSTRALLLLQNLPFIGAIVLYAALSVLWVWLLTFTPLSRAYPFVAVAFALTPILGALVFAEPLSARLLAGIAVIACGLVLVVG